VLKPPPTSLPTRTVTPLCVSDRRCEYRLSFFSFPPCENKTLGLFFFLPQESIPCFSCEPANQLRTYRLLSAISADVPSPLSPCQVSHAPLHSDPLKVWNQSFPSFPPTRPDPRAQRIGPRLLKMRLFSWHEEPGSARR